MFLSTLYVVIQSVGWQYQQRAPVHSDLPHTTSPAGVQSRSMCQAMWFPPIPCTLKPDQTDSNWPDLVWASHSHQDRCDYKAPNAQWETPLLMLMSDLAVTLTARGRKLHFTEKNVKLSFVLYSYRRLDLDTNANLVFDEKGKSCTSYILPPFG